MKHTMTIWLALAGSSLAAQGVPWIQVAASGPSGRTETAMAFDSLRGRTVVWGGLSAVNLNAYYPATTWEWDGSAWIEHLVNTPPPRRRHRMVFDSQRGRVVMFGGFDGSGPLFGDTWEWDGASWTQMSASGPAPRQGPAMAYDSVRGRTVLFGGFVIGSPVAAGDTWEWDGNLWTQVSSTGPSPRIRVHMVFDSQRAVTVLHGGLGATALNDTWEWDGVSWVQANVPGPPARNEPALAYDSGRGRTMMFGGGMQGTPVAETWAFDGTAWTRMLDSGPPARDQASMAYDSVRGTMVMFGGAFVAGTSFVLLPGTWERTGGFVHTAVEFGGGCGSPALALASDSAAPPVIGATAQAILTNVPSVAFVAIGFSDTAWGAASLPYPLATFGMPGCDMLQSAELGAVPMTPSGPGMATFGLPVPNSIGFVGLDLYLQAWAPSPGANAAGVIVSNGLHWRVGDL